MLQIDSIEFGSVYCKCVYPQAVMPTGAEVIANKVFVTGTTITTMNGS